MKFQYVPFLFASKSAWEMAIQDPRFSYSMPMSRFMELYNYHLNGSNPQEPQKMVVAVPVVQYTIKKEQQILSQNEIDKLLDAMIQVKQEPEEDFLLKALQQRQRQFDKFSKK